MAKYIDADKILQKLPDDLPYKASVKRVLIQAPTEDVVEVVRCKDCKYFVFEVCTNDFSLNLPKIDDFCSYGERKSQ